MIQYRRQNEIYRHARHFLPLFAHFSSALMFSTPLASTVDQGKGSERDDGGTGKTRPNFAGWIAIRPTRLAKKPSERVIRPS